MWDVTKLAQSTKPVQIVENHADWVFAVAFMPDGKHLLTSSRDKTAKVWDLVAKESVVTFPEHQNTVYAVASKADGSMALSAGEDNQIRFWKPTGDGKQARLVAGHSARIHRLVMHPTKPLFATRAAPIKPSASGTPTTANPCKRSAATPIGFMRWRSVRTVSALLRELTMEKLESGKRPPVNWSWRSMRRRDGKQIVDRESLIVSRKTHTTFSREFLRSRSSRRTRPAS